MDIKTEKLQLINQILQIEDARLIESLKKLLVKNIVKLNKQSETDFWNEISKEQKSRIKLSILQLESGKGIAHAEVMSKFKNKYQ